jgi:hypothetical protein
MLRGYGGKQAVLSGDVQSFVFKSSDEGPFYINAQG